MIPLRKLGLYGGSFDPIHNGHLILAREALENLGLDRVVFIPAKISPHKLLHPPAPPELRCEMVAAAVAGEPGFGWSDCEILREGPSFAVDTVREMRALHPGAEIFYLIGGDNLAALHTWNGIGTLRGLATFVVLSRGEGFADHGFPVISRRVDISSTDIRNRVASGKSVRYLVPEAACAILSQHRLYRND
ncbi:MAG: nicotinate-nucleotide adenylyltransferase [Verrucomicrobiae bacterium]